ncbi:MAG: hypothetical protein JNJ91_10245 [Flavobacteriales bacterium]|nr:hypothetical protein [Flavobacteriales bacterium]
MTERVQYLIAQYQADPLRKEPRNVGVIARMDGRTLARFMGEKEDGRIDGRELRWMSFPDVYRQWVFFWRESGNSVAHLEQLLASNKGNYGLVRGGKVSDIGSDSLEQVVDHLFTRFVSGGFAEAMRTVDQITVPSRKLENAIEIELLGMDILVEDDMPKEGVKHPVRRKHVVQGRREVPFTPAFSQENGALWLIETFDFTGPKQRPLFEHAGFTAYMFSDIRKARGTSKVQAISVLKTDPEAEESKHIANSRKVLLNEGEVVDWNDEVQRKAFLEERRHVAVG